MSTCDKCKFYDRDWQKCKKYDTDVDQGVAICDDFEELSRTHRKQRAKLSRRYYIKHKEEVLISHRAYYRLHAKEIIADKARKRRERGNNEETEKL